MDLAKRLWTWRTHRGMTLQQVSDRSSVSVTLLTKVECGVRDLSTKSLLIVVRKVFLVTMEEFWGELPKVRRTTMRGRPRTVSKPIAGARAA